VQKTRLSMSQKASCDALGRLSCLPTPFLEVVHMRRLGLVTHGENVRATRTRLGSYSAKRAGWDSVGSCPVEGGEEGLASGLAWSPSGS
jgi:hypothetical protein